MRVSVLSEVGGFDRNLFLFFEDDLFCDRARDLGYHHLVHGGVSVVHLDAQSTAPGLRATRRRHWHLAGWSRMYYASRTRGRLAAALTFTTSLARSALKLLLYSAILDRRKMAKYSGACLGLLSYAIGLDAFDARGNPRG